VGRRPEADDVLASDDSPGTVTAGNTDDATGAGRGCVLATGGDDGALARGGTMAGCGTAVGVVSGCGGPAGGVMSGGCPAHGVNVGLRPHLRAFARLEVRNVGGTSRSTIVAPLRSSDRRQRLRDVAGELSAVLPLSISVRTTCRANARRWGRSPT